MPIPENANEATAGRARAGEPPRAPADAATALLGTANSGRALRVFVIWLLAFIAAWCVDVGFSHWFSELAAAGTPFRRALKLSVWASKWYVFVALGGILLLHPRRKELLIGFCVALVIGFGSLHLLKLTVGRARPDCDLGPLYFHPFGMLQGDYTGAPRSEETGELIRGFDSFPSGHSTQVVLLAALLWRYFPRLRALVAFLATLTCLSRIALERHFMSDVVAGVGVALLAVYLAMRIVGARYFPEIRWTDLTLLTASRGPK